MHDLAHANKNKVQLEQISSPSRKIATEQEVNLRKSQQNELAAREDAAFASEQIPKETKLNLASLITIDEKLQALHDNLKKPSSSQISQLCSDWWELTDEAEYAVAQFSKATRDDKAKRDLKHQMVLEILSIAVVNYFTSSPEIFRPSNI